MEQDKLLDVPVTQAQQEAERYAEMSYEIKQKQEKLKSQAEQVIGAMEMIGQKRMSWRDDYGVRHTFEVVSAPEKLKYSRAGEPTN